MKIVKRFWYIVLLAIIAIIMMILFFKDKIESKKESNTTNENQDIVNYAEDYYYNYASIEGINEYQITIKMLKEAITYEKATYNETLLNKCQDDSYVTVILKSGETTPEKLESHLVCEK